MTIHAKLSASGAVRWMNCPGSVKAEEGIEDKSSPYAEKGTVLHDIAEHMLVTKTNGEDFIDKTHEVFDEEGNVYASAFVEASDIDRVREYVDFVNGIPGHLLVEQRVDFSEWVPGGFGTADAVTLHEDTLYVTDLKTGRGVRVDAEDNPQLMLYALGSWAKFSLLQDFEKVQLVIHQPFLDHVSEHTITVDELLEWAENEIKPAAKRALSDDAERSPGASQCKFCKAKDRCREYANEALKAVAEDFDNIETLKIKRTGDLQDDEIAAVLSKLPLVEDFVKTIQQTATDTIMNGGSIPDYKLVHGRSTRKWKDEKEAETAIRKKLKVADAYTKKLISPTQAEKKLGKGHPLIEDLTVRPEGKPTLVPATDKRTAIVFTTVEDDFDGFESDAA